MSLQPSRPEYEDFPTRLSIEQPPIDCAGAGLQLVEMGQPAVAAQVVG